MKTLVQRRRVFLILLVAVLVAIVDLLIGFAIGARGLLLSYEVALFVAKDVIVVVLFGVLVGYTFTSARAATHQQLALEADQRRALLERERETRQQLSEIEAIYDTARVGLAVLDTHYRFIRVNQRLAEMNGRDVDAHLGHSLQEIIPNIAPQAEAIIDRVVSEGQPVTDVEVSGETPAQPGVIRHWIEQWLPLRDADGQIFAVNVVVEEVTTQRAAQKEQERLLALVDAQRSRAESLAHALQEERDILETIMENTSTQLAYLDPAFNFVRVNSAYAVGARMTREMLIGRHHFTLFPNAENKGLFERVRQTGESVEYRGRAFEYANEPERGVTYWDWTLAPVKTPEGRIQGLVISLSDVTEQKRAEAVLLDARDALEGAVRVRTEALTAAVNLLDEEVKERRRVEAQLRLILDQIPAILWTTDTELLYTAVQGAGLRNLGVRNEELIGRPVMSVQGGSDSERAVVLDAHRRALGGESCTYQTTLLSLFYEGYVEPLRDSAGAITGCIGVALDITERRAAEEALRTSETRFRAFFENAPVAVAIQNATGRIIEANPALEHLVGRDSRTLRSLSWAELVHPEDVANDFDLFEELLQGARPNYQIEKRLLCGQGGERWVRVTVSVARDLAASPPLIISMAEDITQAKAAAREIREREHQYRSIFESTSDGLVIVDLEGCIKDANPAASSISGYSWDELRKLSPSDFVDPGRREQFARFMALATQVDRLETQTVGRRRDGVQFDMEVRASRFTYRGQPHILSMVRDITERVRSIQLLESRVKERTRELSALLDISRSISATLEQRTLLALIADQIQTLLPATAVVIYTFDGEQMILAEHRGFEREQTSNAHIDLASPQVLFEARSRQTSFRVTDITAEPADGFTGAVYNQLRNLLPDARSAVWAPLWVQERVIGGLGIVNPVPGHFTKRDGELLSTIANQAAVALENARLYEQARELAVLQERQRLARELHDSVTQALYSLVLMTEATRRLMALNQPERLTVFLGRIAETAQQVLKEMRLLVYELRPTVLARDGLVSALRQRLQTVESRAGIDAQLRVTGSSYIPDHIESELYRVAQEALNNSLKHSGASSVIVELELLADYVRLRVRDNGRGFNPEEHNGGMGLTGMKERSQRLGGVLTLSSETGQGVLVALEIPLTHPET